MKMIPDWARPWLSGAVLLLFLAIGALFIRDPHGKVITGLVCLFAILFISYTLNKRFD